MHFDFQRPYGVVYLVRNGVNGKCYIGQTTQPPINRFEQHRRRVRSSHCRALSAAILKYGDEIFSFEILCISFSKGALDEAEVAMIDAYGALAPGGYNLKSGGSFGTHSIETRAKMSTSKKGTTFSIEVCEGRRQRMLGTSPTAETRAKIAKAMRGRKLSQENIAKLVAANTGRVASLESRALMSKNRSGIPVSEGTKDKIRKANIGKRHSKETKEKMAASQRERWACR